MNTYLAVFVGTPGTRDKEMASGQDTSARDAKGMQAWGQWMADHASSIVENGGPLGKTKSVGPGGVTDIRNGMGGFVLVRAESHDAAAKMFENHPHFSIFPGDAVEVMQVMPIPGR